MIKSQQSKDHIEIMAYVWYQLFVGFKKYS